MNFPLLLPHDPDQLLLNEMTLRPRPKLTRVLTVILCNPCYLVSLVLLRILGSQTEGPNRLHLAKNAEEDQE